MAAVTPTASDAVDYFARGYHTFIACDAAEGRERLVGLIRTAVQDYPLEVIDGAGTLDLSTFAKGTVSACEALLRAIGAPNPDRANMLSTWLSHIQTCYRTEDRQGFLVVNHIDNVIEAQETIQIEGPFREVMQFHDDVAIAWIGSRNTILDIHQDDRPFYLSHRIFWLD